MITVEKVKYSKGNITTEVFYIGEFLVGGVGTFFKFEDKTYKIEELELTSPSALPGCYVTKWKQV